MTLRGKETSVRISNINRGNWDCSLTSSKWQSIETRWLQLSFASIHKNIWFLGCISCFTSFWAALSYSFLMLPPLLIHSPKERLKSVCNPCLWFVKKLNLTSNNQLYFLQSMITSGKCCMYLSCWENFPRALLWWDVFLPLYSTMFMALLTFQEAILLWSVKFNLNFKREKGNPAWKLLFVDLKCLLVISVLFHCSSLCALQCWEKWWY